MRTKSSLTLLAVTVCLALAACERPQPGPTTVIVVRHAEKAAGDDPPLTEAGQQRALALVPVVEDAGVAAIYSTPTKRTLDTVRPASERTGIPVTEAPVDPSAVGSYGQTLAKRILAEHPGQTVLVVSHSNTVPGIVEALAGRPVPPIGDGDYDNLFVVTVVPGGPARVVKARYGAASAAAPAADNSMAAPMTPGR